MENLEKERKIIFFEHFEHSDIFAIVLSNVENQYVNANKIRVKILPSFIDNNAEMITHECYLSEKKMISSQKYGQSISSSWDAYEKKIQENSSMRILYLTRQIRELTTEISNVISYSTKENLLKMIEAL
jgi:hypothetical protein